MTGFKSSVSLCRTRAQLRDDLRGQSEVSTSVALIDNRSLVRKGKHAEIDERCVVCSITTWVSGWTTCFVEQNCLFLPCCVGIVNGLKKIKNPN